MAYKIATCDLEGMPGSPYSQSKAYQIDKTDKESGWDFEQRTWRERLHCNRDGFVVVPPMSIKNCLSEVAKYLSLGVPGKGKKTFTKFFESGIMVFEPSDLLMNGKPLHRDNVEYEDLFVPSDGVRGSGKRVFKRFPLIRDWRFQVTVHLLENTISEQTFAYHLDQAGKFIGLGRFRPAKNGWYGRLKVNDIGWSEG